jgi:hypothetical protein
MRITIIFTLTVLVVGAFQWSGSGKSRALAHAQATLQPNPSSSPDRAGTPARFSDGDFASHVELLERETKKKLANSGSRTPTEFSFVIQRPFVVAGDESKQAVQEYAEATVKWAVDRLKQDFFRSDPNEILDIWLFKDAASYEKHAALLFRRQTDDALRLLLPVSQSSDHEYLNRRRHVGP